MTKVAVLVEDGYEDLEFWYSRMRLEEAGIDVVSVGREMKVYESKHGYPVKADVSAEDLDSSEFDGVIVPGGRKCPDLLRTEPAVLDLVSDLYDGGGVVGAVCHGPWVLVSAGVLEGETVTCYHAIKDDVVNAGAEYRDMEVVTTDRIVTSRKPSDLPAFMAGFMELLG